MSPRHRSQTVVPWLILIVFALLTVGIGVSLYFYYMYQQATVKRAELEELSAIADLKVNDIVTWRNDWLAEARLIGDDRLRNMHLQQLLRGRSSRSIKEETLEWMRQLRDHFHCSAVLLVDTSLLVIQSSPEKSTFVGFQEATFVRQALMTRSEVLSDFFRDEVSQALIIETIIPSLAVHGSGRMVEPLGAIILRIDPNQSFYPSLQSWPTPGQTNEVLIVHREGDQVVFLNELRHRKQTALALRFPLSSERLPAAMAARGYSGIVEGIDYRNIPVLAAIRKIPDSPWSLIAKIDMEEVEAPVRERGWTIALIVGLLVLFAGAAAVSLSWYERVRHFRRRYESEVERQALLRHFQSLTKFANDSILLTNSTGNILEVNDRALDTYGFTRGEFSELNIRNLLVPGVGAHVEDLMKRVQELDGLVFETVHQRVDGRSFDVEVSSRAITVSGITFYQHIIRDITERKQREKRILALGSLHEMLRSITKAIHRSHNLQDLSDEVCRIVVEEGRFPAAWLGIADGKIESMVVTSTHGVMGRLSVRRCMLGEGGADGKAPGVVAIREGHNVVCNNIARTQPLPRWSKEALKYGLRSVACFPLKSSGTVFGVFGLCADEATFFGDKEVTLLEQAAEDISQAFQSMKKMETIG